MKNLTGTETDKNLRNAFSGESEAAMKYSFYAYAARQEGYQQIADIFDETASNEREHAEIWFKELNGISNTRDNLIAAADLALKFEQIARIEKEHEARYEKLTQNIDNNQVFSKPEKIRWICKHCGFSFEGTDAPPNCPVCGVPQAYFEQKAENY